MDKDPRTAGPQVGEVNDSHEPNGDEPDRSPEQIRDDIEQTREQLGDTAAALAEKTDLKGQAQQRIADIKQNARDKRDEFTAKAKSTTPDSAQQGGRQIVTKVRENPRAVAVGGAVLAGFLLGRLTSRSS
jgi:ElaB/YqjD/DUF883 family membrane-anchored ribosome-binding protein